MQQVRIVAWPNQAKKKQNLLDKLRTAFIDEAYQDERAVIRKCIRHPQDVADRKHWQQELNTLENWRMLKVFLPVPMSAIAIIISVFALIT